MKAEKTIKRIEELSKDAARYRWLCASGKYVPDPFKKGWANGNWCEDKAALDRAIDEAMLAELAFTA